MTTAPRRFDLCGRCGIPVQPAWRKPRFCRDCRTTDPDYTRMQGDA